MTVLTSVGLGLRRDFIDSFLNLDTYPDFIEVAPENWMGFGGRHAKLLEQCAEKAPLICHGLSLSIGGPHPLNIEFIQQIKTFLKRYQVMTYSEHLSYTNDGGFLYDLLPIPMTEDAVHYVSELLQFTYQQHGVKPTLLERDFNIPSWQELQDELNKIQRIQKQYLVSSSLSDVSSLIGS